MLISRRSPKTRLTRVPRDIREAQKPTGEREWCVFKKPCLSQEICVISSIQSNIKEGFLANHKSAEKRIRSSARRARMNKYWKSSIRTFEKRLKKSIGDKNKKETAVLLKNFFSLVDKAKKRGVIHKNTAGRKKAGFSIRASRIS